jgi:hypothetical protein
MPLQLLSKPAAPGSDGALPSAAKTDRNPMMPCCRALACSRERLAVSDCSALACCRERSPDSPSALPNAASSLCGGSLPLAIAGCWSAPDARFCAPG